MGRQNTVQGYEQADQQAQKQAICVADLVSVVKMDAEKMTVDVQPLVRVPDRDQYQDKSQILAVPVAMIYGGGFVVRPVYSAGDIGVLLYFDRDTDSSLVDGSQTDPNTGRLHSGDDAVFIGGVKVDSKTITGLPGGTLCAGTDTGSVYLSISKSGIEIKGDVTVTGSVKVTGDVTAGNVSLKNHTHTCPDGTTSKPN